MWRVAETHRNQIAVTQTAASGSIASAERIKVGWFQYAGLGLGSQIPGGTV